MLDNIEKNTEDQTDPFAKYGGKKIVKNEDPFSKYGGSALKKKESSQPTSQPKQSASSTQQKERLISAVTGQQQNQQASATSDGEPKIGTFTGFTPEQLKSMKAPEPGYMAPKDSKELENLKPYIKKTQLKKELGKTKVTSENQEDVLAKIQEVERLDAQTKQIEKQRLDRIEKEFVESKDSKSAEIESEKRLNDLLSNTGVLNNIKSIAKDAYNTVISGLAASSPLSAGMANLAINTDPLAEEKKQVRIDASKEKIDLSEQEILDRAKQLFKDKQIDNIETDRVNSFLDNLPEEDKEALKQRRYDTSVHLQEENVKNEKAINAYTVIGNKKIEEYKDIENQLKSFNEKGIQFPEELYNKYMSLSSEIKNISENIQKRQDLLIKNKKDLGTTKQEFDLLKRQYGDVENFMLKTGIAARELGIGILSGLDYIGSQSGPGAKASSIGTQAFLMEAKKGLDEERENLRKSVEGIESVEGFVNYASDLVANQIPSLVATSTGVGGLGVIGVSGAGQKYTEMNQEVLEGKASYSPEQMALAPLFYGSAEVVSEIPTLSILKKGGRVLDAVAKNESDLLTKTALQKGKEFAKDFLGDQIKEGSGEQFTNFAQNVNDKFLLGKKDVGLLDNTGTVFKDTFTLTSMLKASPHLLGLAIKPFQSNTDLNVLDENSRKILQFSKSLNTLNLTEKEKSVIQKQIDKATLDNSKIIANTIDKIANMPDDAYLKVNELNKKAAQIKEDARVVNDGNLPNKETILKDLENQYREVQIERSDLISAKYNKKVEPVAEVKPTDTKQPVITAETSSNFANMTQDGEGNFVFYHVSPTTLDVIDPSKYGSNAGNVTSKDEKAAIGRVGGVSMFYTDPTDSENMVNGNKHVVKIPESEVYDFNSDPENFIDEAEKQFKEANPNLPFTANDQFAWITKVAGDNGYKMVVGEWGKGKTRAQTTQKLVPVDVMELNGNVVTKPFEKEYVGNREKGFKAVIPQSKQSKIKEAKSAINSFRSRAGKYDELYQAVSGSRPNMTDEEIKKLVDESDIPQELKDQYNEAMAYEPGKRRTEAPAAAYERTDDVSLDNAPEGTYLNIGLNIGTTQDLMDKDDVISMLPEGVEVLDQGVNEAISEIDGKENKELTLSVKLSRPLTDAEMAKFLVDTKQKAIPQMSDSKGAMHGTKEWGDFNPEYFYMPDGSKLSDTASLTKDVDAELEALNKLFDESEQGGKVTDEQIENGKKAIENLVPDVEWVIHETNESMREATGDINKGEYIMTTDKDGNVKKVIHINKAAADGTTVAHEVFHAVLLDKVLNDADAQELTRRMMKAVAKTASPELKRELDDFARNYEENIRDEEKLAQLIGILAKNYDQLSQPNKTIIKKWLDKLAKMFGLKPFTDNEVIDLLNIIAGKTAKGEAITEEDVKVLSSGVSTYISEPTEIKRFQSKNEEKVKVGDHKLSFVKESDIIDFDSLMKDISDKKQKVWFWVADQLGRGNYFDVKIDGEHYLDAGPSFALDPVNRDKNVIWATGKEENEINKLIGQSDYIFIISGSPTKSKLFNKEVFNLFEKRIGDYNSFKKEVLESNPTKPMRDVLNAHNSWDTLREDASVDNAKTKTIGTGRKKFLIALLDAMEKPKSKAYNTYQKRNAFIDVNDIRDGFYKDNNFSQNDVMLVLKPTGFGGKSKHSTYENDILGDVVGVPDIKVNAFDIMTNEVKDKYKKVLQITEQQQAVAPYGIGVKTIQRSQKSGEVKIRRKQIVGENAKLSEDVRDNLDVARSMEAAKKSARTIRIATGWERGADDKWRYEVPDNIPFFKNVFTAINKLLNTDKFSDGLSIKGNNFLPKELLNLYPDLNDINFQVIKTGNENEASYNYKTKTIEVSLGVYPTNTISSLLHEIQHVIQDKEGFTQGGNLSLSVLIAITSLEKKLAKPLENATRNDIISLDLNKKEQSFRNFVLDTFYSKEDGSTELLNKNAYKIYKKLSGEVESRNVEKRINMTPEQRRKTTLQKTEDVSREDQIIFFRETKRSQKSGDKSENFFDKMDALFPNDHILGGYAATDSKGNLLGRISMSKIDGNTVKINEVVSEKKGQRTGNGSAIMKIVTENADKNNVNLTLTPNLIGDMKVKGFETAKKLEDFYSKFGFIKDKGRATMTRLSETKRSQKSIVDYVRIAKANNFSDDAIRKFLKSKGFSDTDIDAAMSARTTGTGRPSVNDIYDKSKKAIEDRRKKMSIKDLGPFLRKSILDRQAYIKRLINKIDNKSAKKAYDLLVTKAGASALASERFKRAEKTIYGGLSSKEVTMLDKIIYAKRMVAVNESRAKLGMEPYKGMDGYSLEDAKQDLADFKSLLGDNKFNDLNNRATAYFDVFKTNLKKLYDSGRISKETYDSLKDTEYSPIKTIKYIIGDNLSVDEIDTQAKSLGISRKDIMKLSDSNENEIIMDSKWLLAMNISSVEGRAFENNMLREFDRAIKGATAEEKKAFEEFILDNPVVGTKKDGGLKYKYDDTKLPVGFVKVSYFNDGNKVDIVIKDEYAKQLLDVKNNNKSLEKLGALTGTKILRFFATGGNPLFIIGNTAVDFQNIAFFSNVYSKFKPIATVQLARDYVKNFVKKLVVSKEYNKIFNEYINHGGALDYMASDGLRALESMNPIKGVTKAAQRGLIAYGRAMAFLGETSEVAFRLSVFEKVKNDSIKEFEKENNRKPNAQELDDIMWKAARESRETMDFSQGGDVAKNIDAVFPYFNAALQGIRRPIDFAKKDPVGFSASVLQYTVMASGLAAGAFAMLIKAVRDDEDDDKKANKKIMDALNSLSEYEKANYHIIFTGNKNNDGEYEYYRVKKLPVLSVISTVAEQLIYKQFFNSQGVDYDVDSEAMMEAVSKSNPLPITVQEVAAKNPVASGLVSYWANKDTFTGDKIFREPNNKKISPEAEGMFDDKVDQIYKDLAPGFGLSPARTKVMVEKVITSANTNPTIPLMYSAYDGLFNNNDGLGAEVQDAMSNVGEAFGKKLVRYTDKNVMRYKEQDKMELQETVIETDVWEKEQKVYNEIKNRYKDGDKMTNKELFDIVEKNFEPIDRIKYIKKYNAYIHNMNVDKSVLDIIFEDVPEVQAMKLNQRYGSDLGEDELKELTKASASAGKRVNNKALYIYNQKYKNRKD